MPAPPAPAPRRSRPAPRISRSPAASSPHKLRTYGKRQPGLAVAPARAHFALAGGMFLAILHGAELGRLARPLHPAAPSGAAFFFAGRDGAALVWVGAEDDLAGAFHTILHRRRIGVLLGRLIPAQAEFAGRTIVGQGAVAGDGGGRGGEQQRRQGGGKEGCATHGGEPPWRAMRRSLAYRPAARKRQ